MTRSYEDQIAYCHGENPTSNVGITINGDLISRTDVHPYWRAKLMKDADTQTASKVQFPRCEAIPAGDAGVLSVSFVVPDSAVATGAVLPSDVTSMFVELSSTNPPFISFSD